MVKSTINKHEIKEGGLSFLHSSGLKALEEFPSKERYIPQEVKAEQMIQILNNSYKKTNGELAGLFTVNEAMLIVGAFTSYIYISDEFASDKNILIREVKGAIEFEGLDELLKVDKDKIIKKLENLTEFQCFCVIRQTIEVLSTGIGTEEKLRYVFGIE